MDVICIHRFQMLICSNNIWNKYLFGSFDKHYAKEKAKIEYSKIVGTDLDFSEVPQEMLVVVTELTINAITSRFISRYGCEEYFKHNKDLLFFERQKEIEAVLSELNLD